MKNFAVNNKDPDQIIPLEKFFPSFIAFDIKYIIWGLESPKVTDKTTWSSKEIIKEVIPTFSDILNCV